METTRDKTTAVAGVLFGLCTVAMLIATVPPPKPSASGSAVRTYFAAHNTGTIVVGLAMALSALALIVLSSAWGRTARAASATAAASLLLGGVLYAQLAESGSRLDDTSTVAVFDLCREVMYVVPAFALALLLAGYAAHRDGRWAIGSWVLAALSLTAATFTFASTSDTANGAGFTVRLLLTVWLVALGFARAEPSAAVAR